MASYDYDVIVIGSGSGGTIAAQQLAKNGKSVALIEKSKVGGSSSRYETIPYHAIRHSAHVYQAAKHSSKLGIRGSHIGYNFPSIQAWKKLVVNRTGVQNSRQHLLNLGINIVEGRAYFIDPHTISVGNARFSAREFLIATGSQLTLPDVPGLSESGFLTSKEALSLARPPKSIAILGGGSVGCELAELFASFGTKIYLIDSASRILHSEEPEVSDVIAERFAVDLSMSIVTDATLEAVQKIGMHRRLSVNAAGRSQTILVDEIVLATPTKAYTDLGLENAGVAYQDGGITVDQTMQTSAKHIYAAGSCTGFGGSRGSHLSGYQSQVAAYNLSHQKKLFADYRSVARVTFTTPEIATVGLTEQMLKNDGIGFRSATTPLSVIPKSNIANFSNGFVKLIINNKTGVIIGATIVSPQASEMIHEVSLAIQHYLSASQLAQTVHVFPTWSEAIRVTALKLAKSQ